MTSPAAPEFIPGPLVFLVCFDWKGGPRLRQLLSPSSAFDRQRPRHSHTVCRVCSVNGIATPPKRLDE